jgi:glycerophosphoryl diester phosphodiesterase
VAALNDGRCDAVSVDRRFVTGSLVEAVHLAGGRLLVWTVDDAVELRRFAALGVDALVTNDPALGRSR